MQHGDTRLMAQVVVLLIDMVAIAGLGETAYPNRKELLPDAAKVETLRPHADVNAVQSLAEEIEKRSGHEPPADLIHVTSPRSYLFRGAAVFILGVSGLVFAPLFAVLNRKRGYPDNPRRLRRWVIVLAAIGVMAAAGGVYLFVTGYQQRERLAREGRTAQAVVTAQWGNRSAWVKHAGYIAYRFVTQLPDGSTHAVACRGSMADEKLYRKLEIGEEFTVRYLPSDLRVGEPVMGTHSAEQ